jgi:hypothetical protein
MSDVTNSARFDAGQGFRDLGRIAREEAQSTADEWEQAMAKVAAQRKAQAAETSKGLGQAMNDMNAKAKDFENRLLRLVWMQVKPRKKKERSIR